MTQEDKNLLLKDLSGRIPYNVKIQTPDGDTIELYSIGNCEMDDTKTRLFINGGYYPDVVKPYLRSMSSITEEEEKEYDKTFDWDYSIQGTPFDWLNAHHFDYRGLIEKGLALEAPDGMYKTE